MVTSITYADRVCCDAPTSLLSNKAFHVPLFFDATQAVHRDTKKEAVLYHGFKKHSGRVGRTNSISLSEKVLLAVIAHSPQTYGI
jgi:hypothetical protein